MPLVGDEGACSQATMKRRAPMKSDSLHRIANETGVS